MCIFTADYAGREVMVMELKEALSNIRNYNKGLSTLSCTAIEKAFIKGINERQDYFYGFNFALDIVEQDMEAFLRSEKQFHGLLKEHGDKLCDYLLHVQEFSCNTGMVRMDVRSKDIQSYANRMMSAITAFYFFYGAGLDMKSLVYGEYRQLFYNVDFSSVIASELFAQNEVVIQLCKDVMLSENNTAVLTRDVIIAIEKSHNEELWELLGKLLIAASLQEGLRQSILESADEFQLGCFMMLQDIIVEKNLLRFSSVQRSVLTWIGIGFDLVKEKDVKLIFDMVYRFYRDETLRKEALGKDPLQTYLALYVQGAKQLEIAMREAENLLQSGERVLVASALVYMKLTMQFDCMKYCDFLTIYQEDEWITALYLSEFSRYVKPKISKKEDASFLFDHIERFVSTMKATQTYASQGFAWFSITLQKNSLCNALYQLLLISKETSHIERFLPYVSSSLYYKDMQEFMKQLFPKVGIEAKKSFLLKEIISANTKLQKQIEAIYLETSLNEADILLLEERLKSKNAKARASIVRILAAQKEDQIKASYERLLASKQKTIQDCALELQGKAESVLGKQKKMTAVMHDESEGFGFYIPQKSYTYQPVQCLQMSKKGLFRKEVIDVSKLFPMSKHKAMNYFETWSKRLVAMEEEEYYTGSEYRQLKSGYLFPVDYQKKSIEALPFAKQWIAFFEEDHLSDAELFQVCFLLEACHDEEDLSSMIQGCSDFYTIRYTELSKLPYLTIIERIHSYYCMDHTASRTEFALGLWELVIHYCKRNYYNFRLYSKEIQKRSVSSLRSMMYLSRCIELTSSDDAQFVRIFPIYAQAYGKFHLESDQDVHNKFNIDPLILTRAYLLGCIQKEELLEQLLTTHEPKQQYYYWGSDGRSQLFSAYSNAYFEGRGIRGKPHMDMSEYHSMASPEVILCLRELLDEVCGTLLAMEAGRLNEETPVTRLVKQLYVINGATHLINALSIVDKEELKRHEGGDDRVSVFTDVIRRCYPIMEEDSAALLQEAGISEQRLVEVAMLAPQWIAIINEVLQWPGFQDACFYFIAHMKSYDYQQKKAEIARFTDIEPEDLNDGAFDMDWCKRVYEQLGPKRFQMIYRSAKFLCENSFHTRARKYADACLALVDKESLLIQAREKRNKDALNAYCIYPIENDADLLKRYLYVQQFIKEARKFGAQRQQSEKRAAAMALVNLARNSRFESETRLSWMMESEMIAQNAHYLKPQQIMDVEVWISIDEQGHNEIKVSKKGKQQKSIPAALKKNETILEIKEVHQQWNEQYRRSRAMLQQAMEDRSYFGQEEVHVMAKNPIVAPMLSKLILISEDHLGFYQDGRLQGIIESYPIKDQIRIAHTYDLYRLEQWADYQKLLFTQQLVQPFKQVFRELYLKLEDELDQTNTKRYSGYQIQPKKASATLKTRKWNVSYESGLERIYYKDDVVVNLYADADWFAPSDIEAPSIDYVSFSSRNSYQGKKIRDIDDIVFSETMRDIDLAVSTAYVGGVDPTTSFSTMQLRHTIISYTCELMKLDNIHIQDHFVNIKGVLNDYSVHLGSGMIHQAHGGALHIIPVFSGQRGKVFLPFLDEDPKTAEILSKVLLLAKDGAIKDPSILSQIMTRS